MDDYKIILYIIGVILYWFFTKFIKGRKNAETENESQNQSPEVPSARLEDMLKQNRPAGRIQEVLNEAARKSSEKIASKAVPSYEKAYQKAYSSENNQPAALNRPVILKNDTFNSFARTENKVHPLAAILQSPSGARNAVVLSEILKRKDF